MLRFVLWLAYLIVSSKVIKVGGKHMKMSSASSFILMQIKLIFIRMVWLLDSLWNRGTRELGNGLLWQAGISLAASPLANSFAPTRIFPRARREFHSRRSRSQIPSHPRGNMAAPPPLAHSRIPPATQSMLFLATLTAPRKSNSNLQCKRTITILISSNYYTSKENCKENQRRLVCGTLFAWVLSVFPQWKKKSNKVRSLNNISLPVWLDM